MRDYIAILTCACAITGLLALARLPQVILPGTQAQVSDRYTAQLVLADDPGAAPQRLARL